jgi:hypothetical protein
MDTVVRHSMLGSTPGRDSRSEAIDILTLINNPASINAELVRRPDCREAVYRYR